MRCLSLDSILPALGRSIDNRRGLMVVDRGGPSLRSENLVKVPAVWDQNNVPIVEIGDLHRVPLDVVARYVPIAADVVGVDGRLIPVDVENGVFQGGRTRCGHGFTGPPGCHTALTLHDVDAGCIIPVVIQRAKSEPKRACQANPRGASRESHKGCGRCGMAVERFRVEFQKEGCLGNRVATEAQKILQAELVALVRG